MKSYIYFLILGIISLSQLLTAKTGIPNDLKTYVQAEDPSTKWELLGKSQISNTDILNIHLVSQTWQGLVWDHNLFLLYPHNAEPTNTMVLFNNGGKVDLSKAGDLKKLMIGINLAEKMKAPVAVLLGVPRQPLYDGLTEDKLIAETFIRYLDSGDSSWPLLFPMVKSVVKAMDCIQDIVQKNELPKVDQFLVTGASKRGWTSWLTAAADSRVSAIAPMVIDILNIPEQLPHQFETLGGPSEQIHPYTERGLIPLPQTERAQKLWAMVDPFTYHELYTMPKIIVLGNNDPYWSTDALNLYWDEIPGPKLISYTPNAGHNLTPVDKDGKKGTPQLALENVAAFTRLQLQNKPLPSINWKHGSGENGKVFTLDIEASPRPTKVELLFAKSDTQDFRKSYWEAKEFDVPQEGTIHLTQAAPDTGYLALYGRLTYPVDELSLKVATQLNVAAAPKTEQ